MTQNRVSDWHNRWRACSILVLGLSSVLWVTPALGQGLKPEPEGVQPEQPEEAGPAKMKPRLPVPSVPGQPAAAGPAPEAPVEAPKEAPSVEHRPESAERIRGLKERLLDVLTTDAGTNVTTFLRRFQLTNQYRDRSDPSRQNDTVARADWPIFGGVGVLRMDVPVRWVDPNTTGTTTSTGLGDILFRGGLRLLTRPGFKFFAGADVIFPTASESALGSGKYQLGPGATASIPLPALNSIFFPLIQHIQSVGGDPGRADVNFTQFRFETTTPWTRVWWTTIEPKLTVDWTKQADTSMTLEFEVGRTLGPNYRTWMRGGAGLWGDGVAGSYDWIAEAGVRYLF